MSDIIRRARAVAIAVSGPLDADFAGESLQRWGERAWTMPELLLYTGELPIYIYEKEKDQGYHHWRELEPRTIPRRELWNKAWSDTAYAGQLIDHYEGSLTLTPLQLNTVAVRCLQDRYTSEEYLEGDLAYILMGLLRHRPAIVSSDNEFQAFARLSLANDSNMFLERMICLLPTSIDADWWSMDDFWNATLWDIYPKTQICGIGEGDTVILDGAHGATIRWDKFVPVRTLGQETLRHRVVRWVVRSGPLFLIPGILSLIPGIIIAAVVHGNTDGGDDENNDGNNNGNNNGNTNGNTALLIAGGVMVGLAWLTICLSPWLLRKIYCTPTHDSQPFFFGIEGYMDKYQLELLIFGSYEGRLTWSVASSPLSRHDLDREGMRRDFPTLRDEESIVGQKMYTGLDPVKCDSGVRERVERAQKDSEASAQKDMKIFTLVDTYTMTVTLFEAVRPPTAVIMCGAEGGMQRALLCSEDWRTGTLYRETVLRMETRVWDKMDTTARIRLGLKRAKANTHIKSPYRSYRSRRHDESVAGGSDF
ncbi:MAG: hypothetical protein Q9219_006078 [cf. Caloplaca sp. 3 TL-2023]